jgi:hypothetical protein
MDVDVELRRGVDPRTRAAEFCTQQAIKPWASCVDGVASELEKAQAHARSEL